MTSRSLQTSMKGRQKGVVAIEFALVFLFGMLPLLMLTFTGVLVFAAQQSLTLAATEGARAALRYGATGAEAPRIAQACESTKQPMQWLLTFSGQTSACSASVAPCLSDATVRCITVTTSYDYDRHPFLPGTSALFNLTFGAAGLSSNAVVQLEPTT